MFSGKGGFKNKGGRGGKTYGRGTSQGGGYARAHRGSYNGGSDRVDYKARCADCGDNCTVPFKPNGSKPVLCRSCFQGNEKSSFKGGRNDRFDGKRSFTRTPAKKHEGPTLRDEIQDLHKKLDRILFLLNKGTDASVDHVEDVSDTLVFDGEETDIQ